MDYPTVLLDHLSALTPTLADSDGFAGSDAGVGDALSVLIYTLHGVIASYCGMQLTVVHHGSPVILTAFDNHPPTASTPHPPSEGASGAGPVAVTSLRVRLDLLDPGFEPGSRIVVYAAVRGALVDMAADLTYALTTGRVSGRNSPGGTWARTTCSGPRPASGGRTQGAAPVDRRPLLTLDTDLPPSTNMCGLTGLEELSAIERAVGVMIERGHHPDEVYATLRCEAAAEQLTPHRFAVGLVAERH